MGKIRCSRNPMHYKSHNATYIVPTCLLCCHMALIRLPPGPSSLPSDPSFPQGGSAATATAAALAEAVATGGCGSVSQVSDAVTVPKRIRRYRYKP